MNPLRRVASVALLGLATTVFGAAASISFVTDSLGGATAATPRCTTAGLTIFQNLSAGTVVSVTISGLPAACGGALAQATVNNGAVSGSGSATVPGGGGSVTVPLAVAPAVTAAEQTDVLLTGP